MKKEEKKEENKNISNITKKASMFEKTNNQAEKFNNKEKNNKEENIKNIFL